MLDKIQNNNSELINQSQSLDRIKSISTTNPFEDNDSAYFIDESQISLEAFEKYQRELDVKKFSEILLQTDEELANNLVIEQAFNGNLSIDDDNFLAELIGSEEFLNDIA